MKYLNAAIFALLVFGTATSASALNITWDSSRTPYPGVEIKRGHSDSPQRYFWATFVDLCTDYVHIDATAPASSRQRTGTWASSAGVQVAVNGDFFEYSTPPIVYGDAVGGGMRWPSSQTGLDNSGDWYHQKHGFIALGDGWVDFTHTENTKQNADAYRAAGFSIDDGWQPDQVSPNPPPGTIALVSGFPELVIEGKVRACPDPAGGADCFRDRGDMRDRHLRTAMGITEDRQTLIFVNTTSSVLGKTLADIMLEVGAWQAFNIDGGGSTTLWTEADGYIHPGGTVRAVANHWGVYAGAASGMPQNPGSCMVPGGCAARAVNGTDDSVFGDYQSDWLGYDAARVLFDMDALNACGQDDKPLACPRCVMTRGEFAHSVARAAGLTLAPPANPTFDDVPPTHPFYAEIEAFAAAGITDGCGEREFCVDKPLKRSHAAAFLSRAANWTFCAPSVPTFDDVPADHLFYEGIEMLAAHCVTNGCSDTEFCPDDELTRQQAVLFVTRTFDIGDANSCWNKCEAGGIGGIDTDCDGAVDQCMAEVDPGDELSNNNTGPDPDPTNNGAGTNNDSQAGGDQSDTGEIDAPETLEVRTDDGCATVVQGRVEASFIALGMLALVFVRRF